MPAGYAIDPAARQGGELLRSDLYLLYVFTVRMIFSFAADPRYTNNYTNLGATIGYQGVMEMKISVKILSCALGM